MQFDDFENSTLLAEPESGTTETTSPIQEEEISEPDRKDKDSERYFQVLLLDINKEYDNLISENLSELESSGEITTKLVYGQKKDLVGKFPGIEVPSDGVKVDPDFTDSRLQSQYATIRFLLQSRKLSQMMVFSWLKKEQVSPEQRILIDLIRGIFYAYNMMPETMWLRAQKLTPQDDEDLARNLLDAKKSNLTSLIKPDHLGYTSMRLVMLLTGQAYYRFAGEPTYRRVWEPLFSTYEMIWEYAIDVSWDTFYARRMDISQAGLNPKPPFTRVTLGYPPRSESNGCHPTDEQIQKWSFADDYHGELPFYPLEESAEWDNEQLKFIVPPYPYLPLSCS